MIERLTERIEVAVRQTEFTNVFKQRFDSSIMHEMYALKRPEAYRLSDAGAISVPERERNDIVSELDELLTKVVGDPKGKTAPSHLKVGLRCPLGGLSVESLGHKPIEDILQESWKRASLLGSVSDDLPY